MRNEQVVKILQNIQSKVKSSDCNVCDYIDGIIAGISEAEEPIKISAPYMGTPRSIDPGFTQPLTCPINVVAQPQDQAQQPAVAHYRGLDTNVK